MEQLFNFRQGRVGQGSQLNVAREHLQRLQQDQQKSQLRPGLRWEKGITPESKRIKGAEGILPVLGYAQAAFHLTHVYRFKFETDSTSCNHAQHTVSRAWFEDETNQPPDMPISFHWSYSESPLDTMGFQTVKVTVSSYKECCRNTELNDSYLCLSVPNIIPTCMA